MKFTRNPNGFWVPKQKEEPKPFKQKETWYCPHCGVYYPKHQQKGEVITIGNIGFEDYIPHMICRMCNKCMGCKNDNH